MPEPRVRATKHSRVSLITAINLIEQFLPIRDHKERLEQLLRAVYQQGYDDGRVMRKQDEETD
jgi:hypothetical protein